MFTYPIVTPAKTSDERREQEAHTEGKVRIVLVLESDDRVSLQVGDVSVADAVLGTLNQHPAQVREEETTVSTVRILIGVGPSMFIKNM